MLKQSRTSAGADVVPPSRPPHRVTPLQGYRLSSAHIALSNQGALLTVAEAPATPLADAGPDSWVQQGITLANPQIPFYLDRMDGWK